MKVAVTGAGGFIGRHVLVELESRSVVATVVLRPSSSTSPSLAKHAPTRMELRDHLPITDVAKCLVSLAMGNRDNGIVNICSGKPISVRKLAEGWIKENGWSIELNLGHYPYPDYEPMAFWGERQKLDRCLDSQ